MPSFTLGDPVQKGALGKLEFLNKGGQGTVYKAPDLTLSGSFVAVYKEYRPSIVRQLNAAALHSLTALLKNMKAPEARDWLDRVAWPLYPVLEGGATVGFVMPAASSGFYANLRLPSQIVSRKLGQAQHYLNADQWLQRRGIAIGQDVKLRILIHVAESLEMLHARDVCVGDVSAKNLLFNPYSNSALSYFIDCDAMCRSNVTVLPQVETDSWDVRAVSNEPLASKVSDSYKFGLLTVRLLLGDQTVRSSGGLKSTHANLATVAAEALSTRPQDRPGIGEWLTALKSELARTPQSVQMPQLPATAGNHASSLLPGQQLTSVRVAATPAPSIPAPGGSAVLQPGSITVPAAQTPHGVPPTTYPRARSRGGMAVVMVVVLLVILIGAYAFRTGSSASSADRQNPNAASSDPRVILDSSAPSSPSTPTGLSAGSSGPSTTVDSPIPAPETPRATNGSPARIAVGLVDISSVDSDPRGQAVGYALNEYFSGINEKDYDRTLAVMDPSGVVDTSDVEQVERLKENLATSFDDRIVVKELSGEGSPLKARVTFRSRQDRDYGPDGDACTLWTLTYQMSEYGDGYRIVTGSAKHRPCS